MMLGSLVTRAWSPTLWRRGYGGTGSGRNALVRDSIRASVAIVGGGPTGLTLSLLLSSFGVSNVVVERKAQVSEHPQAHFINMRTMEVFRQIGTLDEDVRAKSPPIREWRTFRYCESVLGHNFGEIDHFDEYAETSAKLSPTEVAHLSQNRLLPLMLEEAQKSSVARILLGEEVLALQQTSTGVQLETRALGVDGAKPKPKTIEADYLVGADGAHSLVRGAAGIAMEGNAHMQSIMNIHFTSRDLSKSLQGKEAMLYFVYNPKVVGVIVAHSISEGDFVAQIPFFPPMESASKYTKDYCARLLQSAVGKKVDLSVHNARPWTMSALVADVFRKDRVFLAGDSAHLFPPAGGFGMNTGIQDAHNLAWKLAYVVRGQSPREVLDTYSSERRNIAIRNTCLSIMNFEETVKVARAFGLDPLLAKGVVSALEPLKSSFASLQRPVESLGESLLSLGKLQTSSFSPLRPLQQMYLARILTQENSLRLLYPEEDIGFSYTDPELEWTNETTPKWSRTHSSAIFLPKVEVGRRFPHLTVVREDGTRTGGPPRSIIDLIADLRHTFVLVLFGNADHGKALREAITRLNEQGHEYAVTTVFVNSSLANGGESSASEKEVFVRAEVSELNFGSDVTARDLGLGLGVLIRPDGHVADIVDAVGLASASRLRKILSAAGLKPRETLEATTSFDAVLLRVLSSCKS